MTAATEPDEDTPVTDALDFTTAGKRKITAKDKVRFKVDGEPFVMVRPKFSVAVNAVHILDAEGDLSVMEIGADVTRVLWGLFRYIERKPSDDNGDKHGRALLEQRLQDPEDDLDLLDLMPVFKAVLEGMFERPTGARPSSQGKPRSTGRASGAGTRSTRAKTSSTRSRR